MKKYSRIALAVALLVCVTPLVAFASEPGTDPSPILWDPWVVGVVVSAILSGLGL
jgi:hypothetical protein